eukprot:Gb_31174 [translate_table: standard]
MDRKTRQKKAAVDVANNVCMSLILSTIWLGLFVGGVWLVLLEVSPNLYPFLTRTSRPLKAYNMIPRAKLPTIRGTSLIGSAVDSFRAHLDCFSESGQWVYNSTPRHLPWNAVGDLYASQCDGRHSALPGMIVGEILWRDSGEGRAKMGMELLQSSLINNLLRNRSDPQVAEAAASAPSCRTCPGVDVCSDVLGTGKGFKVGFVRNDRISLISNVSNDMWKNFLEWPWIHLLRQWDIKILLLNRGAHFEADDIYVRSLNQLFSFLHAHHPNLLVFFRNTPPGHVNCSTYRAPISQRQQLKGENDQWHWGEFQRQNDLAKKIVEAAEYVYMDVDAMLSIRPDGHTNENDCLHYCLPGPLDAVIESFYNILKLLRTT